VLYLLQGVAYPVTWFAHRLPYVAAESLILASMSLTGALLVWAARHQARRMALLIAGVWWAASASLLAFSLTTDYLLHGPRLMYLGSIGITLLWAIVLEEVQAIPRIGPVLWLLALGYVAITNWQFVRARIDDYHRLTEPVRVLQQEMRDRPGDAGLLLVNLPQWLAPQRNTYALGAEFVTMLGDYLFVEDLVAENLAVDHPVQAIQASDLLASTDYAYGVHHQTPLDQLAWRTDEREWHVFITRYSRAGPQTFHTGWIGSGANASAALAVFGPYRLLTADAERCGAVAHVRLTWQLPPDAEMSPTFSVFVHLLDGDGQVMAQADGPPLALSPSLVPTDPRRLITDLRSIDTPEAPAEQVRVGLYDYVSGQRIAAQDAHAAPLPDDAYGFAVTPCP
jgi:hypothetical protein